MDESILNKFPFLTRSGRIDLETRTHEVGAATTFDSTTTTFDDNTTPPSFDIGPGTPIGVVAIDGDVSNLTSTIVNLSGSSSSITQTVGNQNDAIILEDGADTASGAVLSQVGSITFTDIFQYNVVLLEDESTTTDSILLEDGDDLILEDFFQTASRLDFPPSVYIDDKEKAFTYPSVINIS